MPAAWPPRTVIRKSSGMRTLESALYRGGMGPVAGVDEVALGRLRGSAGGRGLRAGTQPPRQPGSPR